MSLCCVCEARSRPFVAWRAPHGKHVRGGRLQPSCVAPAPRSGDGGTCDSAGAQRAAQQQLQQQQQQPGRRQFMLRSTSLGGLMLVAALGDGADGRTVLNSVLGAYGLPQLKAAKGFSLFDDPEQPFSFEYPKSWVRRRNSLREGFIFSDFNTADQLKLEVFAEPAPGVPLAQAAVAKLVAPAAEIGGDSRLELPPANRIKTETRVVGDKEYTLIAFPSETITRSGYQVRRKNLAVAAARRGQVYVLGCSARSDQFDDAKQALFEHVVDSFRVY